MGLPEKIKNTLTNSKTPATRNPATAESKPQAPAEKSRDPAKRGLPAFKPPQLPDNHRAILVACAATGRASWAVLNKVSDSAGAADKTWAFARNITAVPDPKPGRSARTGLSGPRDSARSLDVSVHDVDLKGFSCAGCGAGGSHGSILVRCNLCNTLQCEPAPAWSCPGCGVHIAADEPMSTFGSLSTNEGSSTDKARAGRGAVGSGPTAKGEIGQSRAIAASSNDEDESR